MATTKNLKKRPKRRRFRFLPLADSYLLENVLGATLRSLTWFAGLFLAFILVNAARKIAQDGLPWALALQSLALQMPRLILFTIPASLLLGTVTTFLEMSSKGELVALMSGGASLWRLLRAPMLIGLVMAIVAFTLQESIVPSAEFQNANVLATAATKFKGSFTLDSRRPDGTIERKIQAAYFDASARVMKFPVIQLFHPDGTNQFQIQSETARWDAKRGLWTFANGQTWIYPKGGGSISTPFKELDVQTDVTPDPDSFKNKAAKSVRDQLEKHNFEMLSVNQIRAYRSELVSKYDGLANDSSKTAAKERHDLRKEIRSQTFGIHDKFALPLVILALVMIGVPLGVRPQRTATPGMAMGLSLLAMMGYYFLWMMCSQWAKGGGVAPIFVAYLPPLALAAIGTFLIARKS